VRRLARELGVRAEDVAATGSDGRVSVDDVKSHVRHILKARPAERRDEQRPLPDFSAFGEVEHVPLHPLRRVIARTVTTNLEIPQVTQFDHADATDLERFREHHRTDDGAPLTITAVLIAIVIRALRQFPAFNASIDLALANLVLKRYINIGVAVDTEDGLLVPVIRNAEHKGLRELASELDALARGARERKLDRKQLEGASFVITNLGGLGTTRFTPLVIPPLVAVLGVGRLETVAVFRGGVFEPRRVLPLSISYDHRAVDGADAARFCRCIAELIEDPLRLLFGGADD
jgi:pyruvate dehydrogenase E2 component (dihydrolipoamide acetyltransferase)